MGNYELSDYIIYVDESGDHSMNDVNKLYPAFVLAFCIFSKAAYLEVVTKEIKGLKFEFWGHDLAILHSFKLRKRVDEFQFLNDQTVRASFVEKLKGVLEQSPFEIISMGIDKRYLREMGFEQCNPYELSLEHCIEESFRFLEDRNQAKKLTHIVIESRGKKEDSQLRTTFDNLVKMHSFSRSVPLLQLHFADKKANNIGLQIADLVAYPIGRYVIDPKRDNPAFRIVEKKLRKYPNYFGNGLKMFPNQQALEKRKTPELSEV